jgi:hypothetical protein
MKRVRIHMILVWFWHSTQEWRALQWSDDTKNGGLFIGIRGLASRDRPALKKIINGCFSECPDQAHQKSERNDVVILRDPQSRPEFLRMRRSIPIVWAGIRLHDCLVLEIPWTVSSAMNLSIALRHISADLYRPLSERPRRDVIPSRAWKFTFA